MIQIKPVKELRIWFNDDSMLVATGDHAAVTTMELQKYARTGFPLFVEPVKNAFYATNQIASFTIIEDEEDKDNATISFY